MTPRIEYDHIADLVEMLVKSVSRRVGHTRFLFEFPYVTTYPIGLQNNISLCGSLFVRMDVDHKATKIRNMVAFRP
jgi:hypothetical protein